MSQETATASGNRIGVSELFAQIALEESIGVERADVQLGHCIAVVRTLPAIAADTHSFFGPLTRAMRSRAVGLGCDMLLCAPSSDNWLEMDIVERCVEHGANGLVVLGGSDGNPDILRARWPGLPVVFVEYDTIGMHSAHMGLDNEAAMSDIVLHLAQKHSKIAHITGMLDTRVGQERLNGYRSTLRRLGHPLRPEYIEGGDFFLPSAYAATKRLLALDDPPDAIACVADVAAVAAIKAIEEAGLRCPEDVAVTGFDDAAWATSLTPSLTTVRQPIQQMGEAAIDSLVAMLANPDSDPPVMLLPGELIVRESCGAQPGERTT